ncbi:MAG: hypothetical protein QNJ70_25775 [Xenococcaceae cyanobacterium MO_207.B15]|nr:hypothetical protein [Xenococcaceae cyanobacterium MO_207.B15]MDJ0746095.1 hypothetical protein [Xenococcaceae cyanobacterium MO_167.B27]
MPRPTQAHLDRTVNKNQPLAVKQKTLSQMQYYMGAKLIEVGIDPQSVTYRWSVKNKGDEQICTLSAFWGDSQEKLLSGKEPLTGAELIDCARANASAGVKTAAKLCGYSTNIEAFQSALTQTIEEMGFSPDSFKNLLDTDAK